MYGVVLVVVLIVIGGLIAFIGDRLGSKVGKKRLTLFGMRPRHTSVFVTIVTGIAITTSTLAVMSISSQNVRTALFGMEKLQTQIQDSQRSLNLAKSALQKAKSEQKDMQQKLKENLQKLKKAESDTRALQEHQKKLLADNATLEQENGKLHQDNLLFQDTNKKLVLQNDRLHTENENLLQRNVDLSSKRIVYQAGELIYSTTLPAVHNRTAAETELKKVIVIANTKVAERLGRYITAHSGIYMYPLEYEDTLQKLANGHSMAIRLVAAANIVQGEPIITSVQLFPNKLIYSTGELIRRDKFVLNGTRQSAQQAMFFFLRDVNISASEKGILPDPLHGSIGVINMEQLYNVIDDITPMKGDIELSAYSRGNTYVLGPLHLLLKVERVMNNGAKR